MYSELICMLRIRNGLKNAIGLNVIIYYVCSVRYDSVQYLKYWTVEFYWELNSICIELSRILCEIKFNYTILISQIILELNLK